MEIKNSWIKREVIIFIGCFAAAFITNIVAVICYKGAWTEIFSQIGYVIIFTAILYALSILLRLTGWLILFSVRKILKRR